MNNNEYVKQWIINSILGYKNEKALVVYGPSGNGKSLFSSMLMEEFSEISAVILKHDQLLSKFNAILHKKKLLVLDEILETSKLYPLIISKQIEINSHLLKPHYIENNLNLLCNVTGDASFIEKEEPFLLVEPLPAIYILRDVKSKIQSHSSHS